MILGFRGKNNSNPLLHEHLFKMVQKESVRLLQCDLFIPLHKNGSEVATLFEMNIIYRSTRNNFFGNQFVFKVEY